MGLEFNYDLGILSEENLFNMVKKHRPYGLHLNVMTVKPLSINF